MADTAAPEGDITPTGGAEQQSDETPGFEPITSQDELNKRFQARIARERAKFADYDDLKQAADELAKIRDGEKTELQKLTDELTAEKARADAAEHAALVASVASTKGVPVAGLTGSTREELEASADELLAWRGTQTPAPKAPAVRDLLSGTTGAGTSDLNPKAAAADALRRMRSG